MAVDLKWHDAYSASRAFDASQKDKGWPPVMTASEIASLQRPYAYGDNQGRRAQAVLRGALEAACESGELACVTKTEQVPVEPNYFEPNDSVSSSSWRERGFTREW